METTPQTVRETLAKLRELPPISVERRLAALEAFWQKVPLAPPPETGAFPWAQVRLGIEALAASAPHCSEPGNLEKPGVLALILAGNTPLLGWPVLHYTVLLGIPVFIKQSRDETIWTRHFIETLAEIDPEVASFLHLDLFPGDDPRTKVLAEGTDAVVAYGSDETIRSLFNGPAGRKWLLPFGHAISIGIWQEGCDDPKNLSHGFARDVLMYGQQGCLSPQAILVNGGQHEAVMVRRWLADALEEMVDELEVPPVTDWATATKVRETLDLLSFRHGSILHDSSLRWVSHVDILHRMLPQPVGFGIVTVMPFVERNWPYILGPLRRTISSVGVAGELSEALQAAIAAEGISRICRAGEMQTPPLDWRNGGVDLRAWLEKSLAS